MLDSLERRLGPKPHTYQGWIAVFREAIEFAQKLVEEPLEDVTELSFLGDFHRLVGADSAPESLKQASSLLKLVKGGQGLNGKQTKCLLSWLDKALHMTHLLPLISGFSNMEAVADEDEGGDETDEDDTLRNGESVSILTKWRSRNENNEAEGSGEVKLTLSLFFSEIH